MPLLLSQIEVRDMADITPCCLSYCRKWINLQGQRAGHGDPDGDRHYQPELRFAFFRQQPDRLPPGIAARHDKPEKEILPG